MIHTINDDGFIDNDDPQFEIITFLILNILT